MKKVLLVSTVTMGLLSCGTVAQAASASATFTFNSAASTSVVLNPLVNFITTTAPVAPGTAIYSIVVAPSSTWSGTLSLSGPDAAKFVISGSNLIVGSTALPAGTYNVTVTATP